MRPMRRLSLFLAACALLALWPRPAVAASPTVVEVIKVEGAIDRPLLGYLNDRLDAAEAEGAVVVLQIDTAGTLDEDGVALAQRVVELGVPVIAWVGPAPARASGAGLLLMYASSLAGVSPGSQTGPLYPIDLAHPDDRPAGLHDTIAGWIQVRDKQTDIDWIDRPLTAAEARHRDIAQVAATSIPDLLGPHRRHDRADTGRPGRAAHPHRDDEAGGRRPGHRRHPIREPRAGRPGAPRRRLAVDGLFPARLRARGSRVRADAAGLRVRRLRGARDAGPRRLRADRRPGELVRPGPARRRDRADGPRRAGEEAGSVDGRGSRSRSRWARWWHGEGWPLPCGSRRG